MIWRLFLWLICAWLVMAIGGLLGISVPFFAAVAVAFLAWVIHLLVSQ